MGIDWIEADYIMTDLGNGMYSYSHECSPDQVKGGTNVKFCANETSGNVNCTGYIGQSFIASNMTFSELNVDLDSVMSRITVIAKDIVYDQYYPPASMELPINDILLESDWSGTPTNYSMNDEGDGIQYFNGVIPAGTFYIKICTASLWYGGEQNPPPHDIWTCTDKSQWTIESPSPSAMFFANTTKPIVLLLVVIGLCLFVFHKMREGTMDTKTLIGIALTVMIGLAFVMAITGM
jgi:hypothetical protein